MNASLTPLVILVGPTAVGKTELSLSLAELLGAEIVSADSRLFYRGMDIGSAKPTPAERANTPHHLIDVAEPDETWSLAVFQQAAGQAIADITRRGRLALMVGGTGQYIRALVEGWEIPPAGENLPLRAALTAWAGQVGAFGLHQRLRTLDPLAAQAIEPQNVRRTIRALEVIFSTGRLFSQQRRSGVKCYETLTLGLHRPRPELYARIDQRIEGMFASGLVAEVQQLLARGYSPELPSLSAIGYREVCACLRGEMTQEEAIAQMRRLTRQFVRRQSNWFSLKDEGIRWFTAGPDTAVLMAQVVEAWRADLHNRVVSG